MGKPTVTTDVHAFGRALVETNDLDPVYVLLWHSQLRSSPDALRRWLLAYWCFYHVGTASWITSAGSDEYWDRMAKAAATKEHPRSSERRHFRGKQAAASIAWLREFGLEDLFDQFGRMSSGCQASDVIEYVTEWRGFGPWIAFKVADMMNALGLMKVRFDLNTAMYEGSPRQACDLLWQKVMRRPVEHGTVPVVSWAVDHVLSDLTDLTAPPRHDRPLSFQEAETVLCKWKSSLAGHYTVGEDVRAVHAGLERYSSCAVGRSLLNTARRRLPLEGLPNDD